MLDLIDIRRVAWDTEKAPEPSEDGDLVEILTNKILERLGK